jgi:CTP:molybdopterin cytidylyltransferase MocA
MPTSSLTPACDPVRSVSVIIPAYNSEAFLENAIRSVLAQSYPIHEVIVVNDGSTDRTGELAAAFGGQVRVVSQQNQGLAASRNNGVAAAASEFVAFLDSDDAWAPEKIERQLAAMAAQPDAVMCYTGLMVVHQDGSQVPTEPSAVEGLALRLRAGNPGIAPSSVLMRRVAFLQSGGFNVALRRCEDWEMWVRLIRIGPFCRVAEPLTLYTSNTTGLSADPKAMFEIAEGLLEGTLLAGLQGPERWLWRRRILSHQAYRSAMTARGAGKLREELRYMLHSVSVWPSPFWHPARYKALAITLRNAAF